MRGFISLADLQVWLLLTVMIITLVLTGIAAVVKAITMLVKHLIPQNSKDRLDWWKDRRADRRLRCQERAARWERRRRERLERKRGNHSASPTPTPTPTNAVGSNLPPDHDPGPLPQASLPGDVVPNGRPGHDPEQRR